MKTINMMLTILFSVMLTMCFSQELKLNHYYPASNFKLTRTNMADSLSTPFVSSIMLSENRFNPYGPNRPSNFFRYEYSCEEISAGWLIGGLVGGVIGYYAGSSYTSGSSVNSDVLGDFISQGMKAGAYIGEDIDKAINEYDYPESDFINNMDYYQWLQTVQNGK